MVTVIVDEHAHRLLNDGSVESSKIYFRKVDTGDDIIILSQEWKTVNPEQDLEMSFGEFDLIRKELQNLNLYFPSDRPKLPKSEKVESIPSELKPV